MDLSSEVLYCGDIKKVKFVLYKQYDVRLATFKDWTGRQNKHLMAETGFFYDKTKNITTCYCCGITCNSWTNDECPWETHLNINPGCDHIQQGLRIDNDNEEDDTIINDIIKTVLIPPRLKGTVNGNKCVYCQRNKINLIFLPCGHLRTCDTCYLQQKQRSSSSLCCLSCNTYIQSVNKAFL